MNSHQVCAGKAVRQRSEGRLLVVLHGALLRLRRYWQLARERRQLASLSDEALKDIGLNRGEVFQESERPFWDDHLGSVDVSARPRRSQF